MGDIGKPVKRVELIPLPAEEPVREPSPELTPAAPDREAVPA